MFLGAETPLGLIEAETRQLIDILKIRFVYGFPE